MKEYADNKTYVKPSTLTEGDPVFVKPAAPRRTTDPAYDKRQYNITSRKGAIITARRGNYRAKRNAQTETFSESPNTTCVLEGPSYWRTIVPEGMSYLNDYHTWMIVSQTLWDRTIPSMYFPSTGQSTPMPNLLTFRAL